MYIITTIPVPITTTTVTLFVRLILKKSNKKITTNEIAPTNRTLSLNELSIFFHIFSSVINIGYNDFS